MIVDFFMNAFYLTLVVGSLVTRTSVQNVWSRKYGKKPLNSVGNNDKTSQFGNEPKNDKTFNAKKADKTTEYFMPLPKKNS